MIDRCYDYAAQAKAEGRPVVGILCEYTPRELIMAAGGVPVCLCGGSADRIPAAEQILPSNLCPLIKSTFGYHLEGSNPFLEWADLVVAETTCDGKKKMFELMAETRPMFVLSLPHNREAALGREQWTAEMRRLRAELERRFHVRVTDEKLRAAIAQMNEERRLRRELAALMRDDAPPFTGRQLLEMKSIISCIPADIERYKNILARAAENNVLREGNEASAEVAKTRENRRPACLETGLRDPADACTGETPMPPVLSSPRLQFSEMYPEGKGPEGAASNSPGQASAPLWVMEKRGPCPEGAASPRSLDRAPDVSRAGSVRVLLTGVPVAHGAERVVDLIEGHGGLIVCQENCTGLKPILDDVDENAADPIQALADKYLATPCSVMTPNTTRLNSLKRLAREFRADCIVDLIWQACLTYDIESAMVRKLAETELQIPFLRIQTDYSPSDSGRIAVRVEAMFENVRMRKTSTSR
jgi:benzoyl-CoA reductase/2-hydroxyglutaryl-CoA dehydratase subunit BcrC/BadD/HgdB